MSSIIELIDQLETIGQENPEQTYNRVEPIIEKLDGLLTDDMSNASLYLNSLLNDLKEPNAEPNEYDDGAKFENYQNDIDFLRNCVMEAQN